MSELNKTVSTKKEFTKERKFTDKESELLKSDIEFETNSLAEDSQLHKSDDNEKKSSDYEIKRGDLITENVLSRPPPQQQVTHQQVNNSNNNILLALKQQLSQSQQLQLETLSDENKRLIKSKLIENNSQKNKFTTLEILQQLLSISEQQQQVQQKQQQELQQGQKQQEQQEHQQVQQKQQQIQNKQLQQQQKQIQQREREQQIQEQQQQQKQFQQRHEQQIQQQKQQFQQQEEQIQQKQQKIQQIQQQQEQIQPQKQQIQQQQIQQQGLAPLNQPQTQKDPFSSPQDLIDHFSNDPGELSRLKAANPALAKAILEKDVKTLTQFIEQRCKVKELEIKDTQGRGDQESIIKDQHSEEYQKTSYEQIQKQNTSNNDSETFIFKTVDPSSFENTHPASAFKFTQSSLPIQQQLALSIIPTTAAAAATTTTTTTTTPTVTATTTPTAPITATTTTTATTKPKVPKNEPLNSNVIETIFYKVWKNVVIRNQILGNLKQRDKMNGFQYDSISNSVWMIRNGYYGLLLDKLKQTKFDNRTKFASMLTTIDDYVLRSIAKQPNQDELLQIIIDYFPHIILSTPDIIDCVCQGGNLSALIIIHQWIESLSWMSSTSTNAMDLSAENGHYEVVKFLLENRSEGCTEKAIIGAAKNGHLHIVTLLARENKPISYVALDMAATFGHFEILEFLYFYTLNSLSPFGKQPKYPSRFIITDYLNNYNETKDKIKQTNNDNNSNSKKSNSNNNNSNSSGSKGKKATTTNIKATTTTTTTTTASTNTITTSMFKLKEEEIQKENQKQIENQICSSASIKGALLNGHMKCVLFLDLNIKQPFELSKEDLNEIASRGNMEVLEYLRRCGVNLASVLDSMCSSSAPEAFIKIQEILQVEAHRNLFKITVKCFENAAIGNQLRTFETLLQHLVLDSYAQDKPFFSKDQLQFTESLDWAAKHENLEMMELINKYFYGIATYALFNAVQSGNVKLIKWLLEKRAEPMPTNAMIPAISTGNINVVSLVYQNTKEEISHHTRECARIHRVRSIYWKISLLSVQNHFSKLIVRDLLTSVNSRFRERFHNEYGSPKFRLFHSVEITNISQFSKDLSLDTKNRYEPIPYKDQHDGQIKFSFPTIEWRCVPDIFFIFNDQNLVSPLNKRIIIIDILAIEPVPKDFDGDREAEQQAIVSEADVSIRSKYIPLVNKLKQPDLFPDFEISVFPIIILNGEKVILDNQFTDLIFMFVPSFTKPFLESKMGYIFESNQKEYGNQITTDESLKNSYVTLQEHLHFVNKPKSRSSGGNDSGKVENKIAPSFNFSLLDNGNRNSNIATTVQNNQHIAELKHKPSKMDGSDNFIFKANTFVIVNPELVKDNHIRLLLKSNATSQTISIKENKIYCDCPIFSFGSKNDKEYCSHVKNIMLGKFELDPIGDQDSTFTNDQFNQIKYNLKLDYKPKQKVLNKVYERS